jgi:histone H3/H4
MDDGAFKLLESATQRTLHAHNFARTSSHASVVLTDLLGRYLHLLASTCAKHAAHAGRTDLVPADAFDALKDAGVDLGDLASFCATEAREMSRYAAHTARRAEDLVEVRSQSPMRTFVCPCTLMLRHHSPQTP